MSDKVNQPLRTFDMTISISYIQKRSVRARTINGAYAAARSSAEADYHGAMEKRSAKE